MLLLFLSTIYVVVLANILDAATGLTNVEARKPLYQGAGYFGGWSLVSKRSGKGERLEIRECKY